MASITKGWLKKREASYDLKSRKERTSITEGWLMSAPTPTLRFYV